MMLSVTFRLLQQVSDGFFNIDFLTFLFNFFINLFQFQAHVFYFWHSLDIINLYFLNSIEIFMEHFFEIFSDWKSDKVVVSEIEELVHFLVKIIEFLFEGSPLVFDNSSHDFFIFLIEWSFNVFQADNSFFGLLLVLGQDLHIIHIVDGILCFLCQFREVLF